MLQFAVAGRGFAVLPDWLVREVAGDMPLATLRIGGAGLHKSIDVGMRRADMGTGYLGRFPRHRPARRAIEFCDS